MEMIVKYLTQDFTECNDRFVEDVPFGQVHETYQRLLEETKHITKNGNLILSITFKPQKERCVRI